MNMKKKMAMALVVILALSMFAVVAPAMAKDKKDQSVSQQDEIAASDNPLKLPVAGSLDGMWANTNPKARGMIKLVIANGQFHGYGSCSPIPCDWGTTPLTYYSTSVSNMVNTAGTAKYDFGFKETIITVQLIGPNKIRAYDFNMFKDSSGRHNYFEYLTFKRV